MDLDGFATWLARSKSHATITTYLSCLRRFSSNLSEEEPTRADVEVFVDTQIRSGISRNTVATAYHAVLSYFRWKGRKDEMRDFEAPKPDNKSPVGVSPEDVEAMLKACKTRRDRAIIALLFESGIRKGELLGMNMYDFRPDDGTITIKSEKARGRVDRRTILIGPRAVQYVKDYLEVREGPGEAIFVSLHGRLNPSTVNVLVHKVAADAGLGHIKPHQLRHGRATQMVRQGVHPSLIMGHMGHSKFETTMKYVHLGTDDMKKSIPSALG